MPKIIFHLVLRPGITSYASMMDITLRRPTANAKGISAICKSTHPLSTFMQLRSEQESWVEDEEEEEADNDVSAEVVTVAEDAGIFEAIIEKRSKNLVIN